MKVFLGGTCAESKWREKIIPQLLCDYFNPVVEDWTQECQEREEQEKKICEYHLYVITPKMKGVYSIAEAVSDSVKLKDKCIFCFTKEEDDRDFTKEELKSLTATAVLITNNGGIYAEDLDTVVSYINFVYSEFYMEKENTLVKIVNKSKYGFPEYKTPLSAGMDLRANIDEPRVLLPMERSLIPTGLFIQLPKGYEAQVRPRSGLALKEGITVLNSPGTIDADYTLEVGVILINLSKGNFVINPGDRIAQLVVAKHERVVWSEVEKLEETERKGGFGHTGVQ